MHKLQDFHLSNFTRHLMKINPSWVAKLSLKCLKISSIKKVKTIE